MLPDGCRVPKVLFFLELDIVKCQFVCYPAYFLYFKNQETDSLNLTNP
jgi:hypothetical protein